MTISVNTIVGRRGSICNNDAFSVVADSTNLLDIIPADSNLTREDILKAFSAAAKNTDNKADIKKVARLKLGIG